MLVFRTERIVLALLMGTAAALSARGGWDDPPGGADPSVDDLPPCVFTLCP